MVCACVCAEMVTKVKDKRCVEQLKKWGISSHLDDIEIDNSHRIAPRTKAAAKSGGDGVIERKKRRSRRGNTLFYQAPSNPMTSNEMYTFITRDLHCLLPENDTVLVVMNDLLNNRSKWHSKEKYVGVLRQHGLPLIIRRYGCISHFEQHPYFFKPVSRVHCRVVVPRRTQGETRGEYIILSHPSDAQVALLYMAQQESLSAQRRILMAAGNFETLLNHHQQHEEEEEEEEEVTLPPSPIHKPKPHCDIVESALQEAFFGSD